MEVMMRIQEATPRLAAHLALIRATMPAYADLLMRPRFAIRYGLLPPLRPITDDMRQMVEDLARCQ